MNFEKYYLLDTNILLEDATNIYKLSQEGKNLIILAETVLDEIDTKKSGFEEIKAGKLLDIPKHLDSQHIGYLYPHNFGGYVEQEYLKEDLVLYENSNIGFEKTLNDWLIKIKEKK